MKSNSLTRWSGLFLLIGGVFYTINGIFQPNNNDPHSPFSPFWLPLQLIITAFYGLNIPGLIGLHWRQRQKTGRLGRIGTILAVLGSALTFITSLAFAFAIPAIAAQQAVPQSPAEMISSRGPLPWIGVLALAFLFVLMPGYFLLGLVTAWAGVLPRWAGLMVSIGMVLIFLGESTPPVVFLRNIGGVLAGLGLAWLGYALWSEKKAN